MHDIFISYSHTDRQTATIVTNVLEINGIKCWIDYRDALPGADFATSIVRAIKNSKFFVLLLSSESSVSTHVLNEINSAAKACVTIIPFRIDEAEISEGMEYYLGKTHWLEALTPPLEAHIQELVEIVKKYDAEPLKSKENLAGSVSYKPIQNTTKGCRMLKYQDMISIGYTATDIALQLVENDYITCNGIGDENEGTAVQWETYLQDNSDTFQYLVNEENKIVGNWSILALTDESFKAAMDGELLEKDIDLEKTNMICFPGVYHGYILAISLLPQYRTMKNYNMLIDSLFHQLEEYSDNGIFFDQWCINVFGKEVEALVKQMGFSFVCDNKVSGKIFSCPFMPLPDIPLIKRYNILIENYGKQ